MKRLDDDGRLAEALAAGAAPDRRDDCLEDDQIWAAARGDLPAETAARILDHSQDCPACAESFRVAAAILAEIHEARIPAPLPSTPGRRFGGTRRALYALAGVAASVLIIVAVRYLMQDREAPAPVTSWVATQLWRIDPAGDKRVDSGGAIRPGDRLYLTVSPDAPVHVYVISRDAKQATDVLFPASDAQWKNPLPAKVPHRLPGDSTWSYDSWEVSPGSGRETLVVIASRDPIAALDAAIASAAAGAPPGGDVVRGSEPGLADPKAVERVIEQLLSSPPSPGNLMIREIVLENRP